MSEKLESFTAKLPAPARQWVEKASALVKALPRPARIFALTTTAALVLLVGYFSIRSSNPPYATLFTNLDRDDAAGVVSKLKEMKVPYRLEGDGAIIEVPEEKARDLRLELAGAGLPRGGAIGFESFDKMKLGATEFEQRIQYRRALEGELSRTIDSVSAVQSARVHLVLPERSVFVSKNEPSSASVVLKLRGGRALGAGEVAGIVHLVSSSVSGLTPDHVSIVTTEGTVLHKPKRAGDDGGEDDRASNARALEATLEERARAMVEKVTGAGHVDVRVSADVDTSRVERVEDHYDPKQTALRSEERSVERNGGEEIPLAGVPGAESNIPGGSARPSTPAAATVAADGGAPAATATTSASGTSRESHTRNFEVDHVTEKRVVTGGVLRRLTVAVVIDGAPVLGGAVRSKEEMDKISSLVRSAVGFDEKRGDAVTVESVPFLSEPVVAPPPPVFSLNSLPFNVKKVAPFAAGGVALLVLLLALKLRSSRKKSAAARKTAMVFAAANAKEKEAAQITVEILGAEAGKPTESSDDLRRLVRERAALDPATAALVVRSWLGSVEHRAPQHEEVAA